MKAKKIQPWRWKNRKTAPKYDKSQVIYQDICLNKKTSKSAIIASIKQQTLKTIRSACKKQLNDF